MIKNNCTKLREKFETDHVVGQKITNVISVHSFLQQSRKHDDLLILNWYLTVLGNLKCFRGFPTANLSGISPKNELLVKLCRDRSCL